MILINQQYTILITNFKIFGDFERKPGSGRKPKIQEIDVERILSIIKENNGNIPLRKIFKILEEDFCSLMSKSAIRRILIKNGYLWRGPVNIPQNTLEMKNKRLDWCRRHYETDWNNVVFIDEVTFYVNSSWNKKKWLLKDEAHSFIKKSKGHKLNMLGAICSKG